MKEKASAPSRAGPELMKILHFSDVHLENGFKRVPTRAFLNKRFVGYMNLSLRRRALFRDAEEKLAALTFFAEEQNIDLSICTGDYTALGTEPELERAARIIAPLANRPLGFVTVPGNHDVYLNDSVGLFEKHFGGWLKTELPELSAGGLWPQVRFFGDDVCVVAINSARPNPDVLTSSGRVPKPQVAALRQIVRHPRVAGRFLFVATHYAPRLKNGQPDAHDHGLENADEILDALGDVPRGAFLHGHVHHNYTVRVPEVKMTLCGAGSATQDGREGAFVYEVDGERATAQALRYDGVGYVAQGDPIAL